MNIAILPSAFYPSLGGVEELTRQLALELRRHGHEVILITNRWPRNLPAYEEIDGLPLYRLPLRWPIAGMKSSISYRFSRIRAELRLCNILRKHQIDVMHVQCVSSNGLYALAAKRRLNIPVVVTLQGELTMDAGQIYQRSKFAKQTLRRCLDEADIVTACSQKTLNDGEDFFHHLLRSRGRVIFNGSLEADFETAEPFANARPYLYAMGRMVPQKGFDVLLKAFKIAGLDKSHDLLIAGDGPDLERLKAIAHELKLDPAVRFVGRADRQGVASYFRGAEFFVLPSTADEGLPVVCAEAMTAGLAIAATRAGGTPEAVLHGETGLLVNKGDAEALAAAMRQLCDDPAMRQSMASAGHARSKLFAWPAIAKQYVSCYEEVVSITAEAPDVEMNSSVAVSAS